jgi:hypothetical protein
MLCRASFTWRAREKPQTQTKKQSTKQGAIYHVALVLRWHQARRNFIGRIVVEKLQHVHHCFQ